MLVLRGISSGGTQTKMVLLPILQMRKLRFRDELPIQAPSPALFLTHRRCSGLNSVPSHQFLSPGTLQCDLI